MDVVVKTIAELNDEEYRYCDEANLHNGGSMQSALRKYRKFNGLALEANARAVMLVNKNYKNAQQLAAWALLFNDNVYFWTKPYNRNKGYGTIVMQAVKELIPVPVIYPWTEESGGFLSKFNCTNGYGKWAEVYLTDKPKVC